MSSSYYWKLGRSFIKKKYLNTKFHNNFRIHAQGNAAKMNNHPDGRAIMFEGQTYSKKKIADFIVTLSAFEDVLKIVALFEGNCVIYNYNLKLPQWD